MTLANQEVCSLASCNSHGYIPEHLVSFNGGGIMPEELEIHTDKLHETIHEEAEKSAEKWILSVALTTALLAVLAAITSLLAGHHANQATIEMIQSADQWAYFQAKGIKAAVLQSKMELLDGLGRDVAAKDKEKAVEYSKEQKDIEEAAREKERSSTANLATYDVLARGVTLFQIAIAMSAISVLTRRKWLWYIGGVLGLAGMVFLIQGLF